MLQPKDTKWLNGYKNKAHMLSTRTHFRPKDTYKLKVRGWKNIFHEIKAKESWSNNPHIRQNRP